jgi:FRG domain
MSNDVGPAELHFNSLSACIDHIRSNFDSTKAVRVKTKDVDTGQAGYDEVPAYFYRGESHVFPKTTSSMQRLKDDESLPSEIRIEIEKISCSAASELESWMGMNQMYSAGFAQHYGLPTELLDITSNIEVAAFFASEGTVGSNGMFCVFSGETLSNTSIVIDLRRAQLPSDCRHRISWAPQ